jgi:hypothetical protein
MSIKTEIKDGAGTNKTVRVSQSNALSVSEDDLFDLNVDNQSDFVSITGIAPIGSSESEPVWKLKKSETSGNITRTRVADEGRFTQVWDNRNDSFPPSFVNEISTEFDGTNDYAVIGDVAPIAFESDDSFSFSVWVNTRENAQKVIFSKQAGTSNEVGYRFELRNLGLRVHLSDGTGRIEVRSSLSLTADIWTNITFSYNGTSTAAGIRIWFDGVEDTSITLTTDTLTGNILTSANAQISGRDTATLYYERFLDEVSAWDVALTSDEVTELYSGGKPINLLDHSRAGNLVGWWRMGDGDSFPTILDNSTNSNHATMTNMTAEDFVTNVPT